MLDIVGCDGPILLCGAAASVCCCTMKDGNLLVDPSSREEQVSPDCKLLGPSRPFVLRP